MKTKNLLSRKLRLNTKLVDAKRKRLKLSRNALAVDVGIPLGSAMWYLANGNLPVNEAMRERLLSRLSKRLGVKRDLLKTGPAARQI